MSSDPWTGSVGGCVFQPVTAQVLATEENGDPALLCNCYGKGKIYFLGFGLERIVDY